MNISTELAARAQDKCEICSSAETLSGLLVAPKSEEVVDHMIAVCATCLEQINKEENLDENHLRCLNESIWSQVPAVQVVSYRLLKKLPNAPYATDLLGMMYMEDETREWAEVSGDQKVIHKDSNGHVLEAGDSVVLIQDLNVKGANFTAKRGTAVRRIRLVPDNAEHIEGKVDGQQIVILTKYVKKS